jgi:GTPase SAR1 family protein
MNVQNRYQKTSVISIVGYAKTGKTTVCERLVLEARRRGYSVGALKTGRTAGHASIDRASGVPDGARLARAGASPSLFWCESGLIDEVTGTVTSTTPLTDAGRFFSAWRMMLPPDVRADLESCDIIVIEGRAVHGARTVHMREADGSREYKYQPQPGDIRIAGPEEIDASIKAILDVIGKEEIDARKTEHNAQIGRAGRSTGRGRTRRGT